MAVRRSEKQIVAAIVKHLVAEGCFVLKTHGGPLQRAGIPDILAIRDSGTAIWFEVKTDNGKATKLQEYTLAQLRAVGCVAEVVRSVEEVKAILEERA